MPTSGSRARDCLFNYSSFFKSGLVPNRFLHVAIVLGVFLTGCASTPKNAPPAAPPTSATAGSTTIVAIAPPAPTGPTTSLPKLLGLDKLAGGICGIAQRLGSRLANTLDLTGRFPELQPQPPILALTDPANLAPDAPPAVQAAAEIKAEEDAAPQKIMAIRYLATLGCGGCYEKVENALLEAMSDCTEVVRFEAVKALQCRPDSCCQFCSSPSCCSPAIRKRLEQLTTCEHEQSTRIRRAARLALACCNAKPVEEDEVPREGPPSAPPISATADTNQADSGQLASATTDSLDIKPGSAIAALVTEMQWLTPGTNAVTPKPNNSTTSPNGPSSQLVDMSTNSSSSAVINAVVPAATSPANQGAPPVQTSSPEPSSVQRAFNTASTTKVVSAGGSAAGGASNQDRLLARVNGHEIYASHLEPLIHRQKQKGVSSILEPAASHAADQRAAWGRTLPQAIDWILLYQQAQQDTYGPGTTRELSPLEVQAWLERKAACDPHVSPNEILAYYQVHQDSYRLPARVKWESVSVLINQCADREQAVAVASYLKSRAQGENVQAPQFLTRSMVDVQVSDWRNVNQLGSPQEQAILSTLPLGHSSQVVDMGDRLVLYRVIEREDGRMQPLSTVSVAIADEILRQRGHATLQRYLMSLRASAQIWTDPEILSLGNASPSSGTAVGP